MLSELIPQGSCVTDAMVLAFAAHCGVETTEDNLPGLVGSLVAWENGQGEFDQDLVDNPIFSDLVDAYHVGATEGTPQDGSFTPSGATGE